VPSEAMRVACPVEPRGARPGLSTLERTTYTQLNSKAHTHRDYTARALSLNPNPERFLRGHLGVAPVWLPV
jgi:hypothetical protein